ncbi:MAG: hypothetical protein IPO53_08985 [Chitinophagaceae bacterium]|nr:hypothetical protein [Chitinophagaceae bacterium]
MKKILAYYFLFSSFTGAGLKMQAQSVNTILNINEGNEASVYQDECVLLDIAIFNKKAQADKLWNITGDQRMDELNELLKQGKIKQEDYDREQTSIKNSRRKTTATELGSGNSSWTSAINWKAMNTANRDNIQLPVTLMKKPATGGKAVLDGDGYYLACYGISPEDMKSVPPGIYAIECLINNIPSNTVLLKVKGGLMDKMKAASDSVLLRAGIFYWHAENGDRTVAYADRILAKNPSSLDGLSLKGDGLVLQKSFLPALETYKKAVKEYYKQNGVGSEPPEYLFSMITFVKKELGQE